MNDDKELSKITSPGIETSQKVQLPPPIPKNISHFTIESLVAEGLISNIYLGFLKGKATPYAIKTLSPSFTQNQEALRRFQNEKEILKLCDHPNIVKYIEEGKGEASDFLAMEYVEGISLKEYLQHNPLSLKSAVEILLDISFAICHLHTLQIVHRDLKPENILITENKGIKLIDFGISKQLQKSEPSSDTVTKKMVIGTPFYMSPEQRKDPDSVTCISDIYSLGIVAYELILGKKSKGKIDIGLLPRGMQKIISKALQEKPEERYPDIISFITDVTSFLNSKELEREQKTQDVIHVFSENLVSLQGMFLPETPAPSFKGLEVGISFQKGLIPTGFLAEFLPLPEDTFGALFAKTDTESPKGIFELSFLKGLIKAFASFLKDPVEIALLLNQFILNESKTGPLSFAFLVVPSDSNTLSFLSCGYGNLSLLQKKTGQLIKIENTNPLLGEKKDFLFTPTLVEWEDGDLLFFNNISSLSPYADLFLEEKNYFSLPPQELSAQLIRKAKVITKGALIKKTPEVLITLQKK